MFRRISWQLFSYVRFGHQRSPELFLHPSPWLFSDGLVGRPSRQQTTTGSWPCLLAYSMNLLMCCCMRASVQVLPLVVMPICSFLPPPPPP